MAMRLTPFVRLATLCTFLMLSALPAQAAAFRYSGFSLVNSHLKEAVAYHAGVSAADQSAWSVDIDDRLTGFNLVTGWQLHRYFALELTYNRFGGSSILGEGTLDESTIKVNNAGVDIDGWGVQAVFTLPLSPKFFLYAKAGSLLWQQEGRLLTAENDTLSSLSFSQSGSSPLWSLGTGYAFTNWFAMRLALNTSKIESQTLDAIHLGFLFKH